MLPLILIVYNMLNRGIQSATEMLLSLEKGNNGVAHSFNCPPLSSGLCLAAVKGFCQELETEMMNIMQ